MDTALNLPATATPAVATAPLLERSITQKVTPIDTSDQSTTRPAERPFVAQVVTARLSGTDYPENLAEIAPEERTLRPYDVPMLPQARDSEDGDAPLTPDKAASDETAEI